MDLILLGPEDLAIANKKGRAAGNSGFVNIDTAGLGQFTLGVKVAEHFQLLKAHGQRPDTLGRMRINRDAKGGYAHFNELIIMVFQISHLIGADGGKSQRMER